MGFCTINPKGAIINDTETSLTEVQKMQGRLEEHFAKERTVAQWHIELHEATGYELPYLGNDTWITCNVWVYPEEGDSYVDEDETVKKLATALNYAVSRGYEVEKKYDDNYFRIIVMISTEPWIRITYNADRKVVCVPKVVGQKLVPASTVVVEEHVEDIIEWECEKLSFMKVATDRD